MYGAAAVGLGFALLVGCGGGDGTGVDAALDANLDANLDAALDADLPDAALDAAQPDAAPELLSFEVTVPANTPPEDQVFVHSGLGGLPMQRTGARSFRLTVTRDDLMGHDFDGTTVHYAYSRDGLGYYGGEFFPSDPAQIPWAGQRSAAFAGPNATVTDTVTRWRYSPADTETLPTLSASTAALAPRPAGWTFQAGIQIADYWPGTVDGPPAYVDATSQAIARTHATWVQVAPPWDYQQLFPRPIIKNDPALVPGYPEADLRSHVRNLKAHGFHVLFRIQVCCTSPTEAQVATASSAWFDDWFAQYDAFVLYHAQLAQQEGVEAILLDWSGNLMLPGAPSAPVDSAARWNAVLDHARAAYTGRLGYDLLTLGGGDPSAPPWPFSSLGPLAARFDFFGIAMWGPLATTTTPTQSQLDQAVAALFAGTFASVSSATGKPVIISGLAYGSYDGAAQAAISESNPGFAAAFDREATATLPYDPLEQAMIVQAVMANIATTPAVVGLYPFHYNWVSLPKDAAFSVRGKTAESVLTQWYATLP
ncbi:MAG: hypothetical protein IT370_22870 [Deltaproteobacteria bacterium]|nr:hypothetical protein [Deltaproteobacteria bacterium]